MPRVLILCEYPSLNGGERSLLTALAAMNCNQTEIAVAAPPSGPLADALKVAGIKQYPIGYRDHSGVRLPLAELRAEIQQLIARAEPDLVHCNSLSTSRIAGPVVQTLGVPSIGHLRDIMTVSAQAIRDLNCHRRLLVVSAATRSWYHSAGLSDQKVHVNYNGVDLDLFRPRSATSFLHRELGLPPTAMLVGSVGQIGIRKGLDILAESAVSVARQHAQVHFVIVGERYSQKAEAEEFEASLRAAANEPELQGRVHFLGTRQDVARLMGEWTLLVHAARQEPLGRVLLEAAASGLAIVATRVGGTEEIFPAELEAARLVPANSSTDLTRAMLDLLPRPNLRLRLGQSARRRAEQQFDARTAGRRLAEHYGQVLEQY